jgi:hypothetical protein
MLSLSHPHGSFTSFRSAGITVCFNDNYNFLISLLGLFSLVLFAAGGGETGV